MKIFKLIILFLYIFSFGYHCFASLQSASDSSSMSEGVTEVIIEASEKVFKKKIEDKEKFHEIIRKVLGHFGYFLYLGLLGFICVFLFKNNIYKSLIISLIIGLFMSITSEFLQLFSIERGPSIKDIFIDYSGYVIGISIIFAIIFVYKKGKERKEKMAQQNLD